MSQVELVHESFCRIGESVIWSVEEQALYWSDSLGKLAKQPLAGCVFSDKTNTKVKAENLFTLRDKQ